MKLMFAVPLVAILSSSLGYASINEVECSGQAGGKELTVEVEQPFPQSSTFRRARLEVAVEADRRSFDYSVVPRLSLGFNRLRYQGGGFRLEVDTWPDQTPRWGRIYRSTVYSPDLKMKEATVQCSFPNAL